MRKTSFGTIYYEQVAPQMSDERVIEELTSRFKIILSENLAEEQSVLRIFFSNKFFTNGAWKQDCHHFDHVLFD